MTTVSFGGRTIALESGETVLDGLLRGGAEVPHACRTGICKACTLQADPACVPPEAQRGLRPSEQRRGVFLACQCRPTVDLDVRPADHAEATQAEVVEVLRPTASLVRLRLRTDAPLDYRAGQYVSLARADGLVRSYSLASRPGDPWLELHIGRVPQGRMSGWACDEVTTGMRVTLRGPYGDCVYDPTQPDAPLLLVGVGTGIAPLWGVAREAVTAGHRAPIVVVEAAADPSGLYLHEELLALARLAPQLELYSCVLRGGGGRIHEGSVDALAVDLCKRAPDRSAHLALLCGDPPIVQRLRRALFLAGVSARRIFADAFVTAPSPSVASPTASTSASLAV